MTKINAEDTTSKPDKNDDEGDGGGVEEEEEEEEEDVDFNPFVKETVSPEASSSLSSEVEGLGGNSPSKSKKKKDKATEVECCPAGDPIQDSSGSSKKRKSVEEEGEDAICKRTRAKYSLASFTLDELETFLQETDDEDDLHHNVDDEEEYRKFLAAVLQGGDGDGVVNEENENVDDDEDVDDADFEIELEELLESDVDDGGKGGGEKMGQRRETRQKRRQNVSAQYKKKLLEQSKRPLRPLPLRPMPLRPVILFLPNGGGGKALTSDEAAAASSNAASEEGGLINGFTPQQIGQLHCLIHEHVQLLIQVFSLCVLDSSRQHIASQVQGLIFEMLHKRDEVIVCKSVPYPGNCFRPPYICPSVSDERNLRPAHCNFESPPTVNLQMPMSQNSSLPQRRGDELPFDGQTSSSPIAGSFWVPFINGPILSILEVAPLNLVGRYKDDVFNAVREYRQRCCQNSNPDAWYEKEPLFYLPPSVSCEANVEVLTGNIPPATSTVSATPGEPPQKKTLAASIVESTKKQSIALVPKDISKLAQRFFPLFNPALFPHKPSPSANRVLFTDAEDELLALGIMEYNTDWKAIQQRFLPCKSKHQIFVRQKNRCSSKVPENPIKVVRRMKTSPLTAEEVERIQEGLRVYKLDWLSVWRFAVPHRDPSLLPRQLRIALGTQKSYKQDTAKKEKRRMAEFKKRCKTADLVNWHSNNEGNQAESTGGGNSSGDDCVDNANEAYVHQAFLSDWRPGTTSLISSDTLSREDNREQPNNSGPGEAQPQIGKMHGFSYGSHSYQYPLTNVKPCPPNTTQPNYQNPNLLRNTAKSQVQMLPYRSRRTDGARLVKLAPDLPPVNLPRSVHIISQSTFKGNQCGSSIKVSATGDVTGVAGKGKIVSQLPHTANLRTTSPVKTKQNKSNQAAEDMTDSHPKESLGAHNAHNTDERGTDSDLQMHPLLFQVPEGGRLPYFPLSCNNGTSSSFSFFSGNQPQSNLSVFPNAHQVNHVGDSLNKSSKMKDSTTASCGIDFHPLLQRTEEENSNLVMACSNPNQFICLRDRSTQFQNNCDAVQMKSLVKNGPFTADPKHSSTSEKANDLDLEIHLSSNSSKEITGGSRDVDATNQPRLIISKPKVGRRVDTTNGPSHNPGERCPTVHSKVVPVANASPVQNNNVSTFIIDSTGDQSHPEIVMEQEELSDSDEEMEEHVEFECEEMDDSDGEDGAGCETVDEVQDQDVPSFVMQEVTADEDDGGQRFELRIPVNNPQGKPSILRKGSPFLKLSLTSIGKETMSSSWLSLDSRTPVDSPSIKSRGEEGTISEGRAAKNLVSCSSNRLCKKTTTSATNDTQKNFSDMAKQLSLGSLSVSTLRKPRKRASRTNTNLGTGMASENGRYNLNKIG